MRNLRFLILTISSRTQICQVQHKRLHHIHASDLKDRFLSQRHKHSTLSSYFHSLFSQSSLHITSSITQTIWWFSLLICGRAIQSILPYRKIKELLQAGIDASNFSGHSLRKGAIVSAAAYGISKEEIKLLGRWKNDAVDVYINEPAEEDQITKLLQLNARLHSHTPN